MERIFLCITSSVGLSMFLSFHRLIAWSEGRGFFSFKGPISKLIPGEASNLEKVIFIGLIWGICTSSYFIFQRVIKHFEAEYLRMKSKDIVQKIGYLAETAGIVYSIVFALYSAIFVFLDTSLMNAWDMSYLVILIGMLYIAAFFYFYYAVSLEKWAAKDPVVELEKLKIEHEELRICFKYFAWSLVAILAGQVFVALRLKFAPFYSQPEKFINEIEQLRPVMALNALQVAYLILVAWATILSRFLRRMEEVKFRLMELKLPKRK